MSRSGVSRTERKAHIDMHIDPAIYHITKWCLPATPETSEVIEQYLHTTFRCPLHLKEDWQFLTAKRLVMVNILRDTDGTGNRKRLCVDSRVAMRARVYRRRHVTATLQKKTSISAIVQVMFIWTNRKLQVLVFRCKIKVVGQDRAFFRNIEIVGVVHGPRMYRRIQGIRLVSVIF